jgi:diphosphomevalonate decarboxylase
MQWFAQAPANIALIKYMGKLDEQTNVPANASLSYTLPHLQSQVMLEPTDNASDTWEMLDAPGIIPYSFSEKAQARFLNHLTFLKQHLGYTGSFHVRSGNTFPHSTGLASSASSFAALTRCAAIACAELTQTPVLSVEQQAQLSRQGSGSSCRSFFQPWALWETNAVRAIELPYHQLLHQVILIHPEAKEVSSSLAHQRIKSSPAYPTRAARANNHLTALLCALQAQHWDEAYHICWQEFQDMHALFSTAHPAFSYMSSQTEIVLARLQFLWKQAGDGPIITMDAGPNIHLLYRQDQEKLALQIKHEFMESYHVL